MIATDQLLVRTEGLLKVYGKKAVVKNVSVSVSRGEIVALLGPNGAGKTTAFYMITGLIRPDAGSVFFNGENVTRMPMYRRARRGMGYLSQEPSIFRRLTVEQNVMAVLETLPLTRKERHMRLAELLEELNLRHLSRQKAFTLSGGERRRLEITRALVTQPALILLDEPFYGIDPITVSDVQQIVLRLREKGLGVLITDHNVTATLSIVDRAYLICKGEVLREGTSDFLINDEVSRKIYLGEEFAM
ncbi:MAG: LPS export ABC transporter ATP-binding protein [Kiritimatiellia bacterium]